MDANLIAVAIFVVLMALFLYKNRKKLSVTGLFPILYVFMYRGKHGIKLMNTWAKKWGKCLRITGVIGIIIGFIGMIFVCFQIVYNIYQILIYPAATSGVQLVLPFEAKGVFYVPFIYWILAIFVVALVHEFSHGLFGRAYKIPVLSTGMAFLGAIVPIIPAAFVEPDEKKFNKFSLRAKLSMLAAGPFANIVLGFVIILLLIPAAPVVGSFYSNDGVNVVQLAPDGPADKIGMAGGEIIHNMDGIDIITTQDFKDFLSEKKKGDIIKLETDQGTFDVALEEKSDEAYIGIFLQQNTKLKEGKNEILASVLSWIYGLFMWIYLLSLGIGLFNLLPMGPLDGGRMLKEILGVKRKKLFLFVSWFFFIIIVFSVGVGFF